MFASSATPALTLSRRAERDRQARRQIKQTLQGPVMTVLAKLLPEVARLPADRAYDTVMNDCTLLHRCFETFRAHRPRFRPLLVNRHGIPVTSDNQTLACGRTFNEVVAMVVRSAAKRHFRARLDDWWRAKPAPRRLQAAQRPAGWWASLLGAAPAPTPKRPRSKADELYDAIKEFLLYDWQVPIISEYARMTPPEVTLLGSRLLEFRTAEELANYLDNELRQPLPASLAPRLPAPPAPLQPAVVGRAALPGENLARDQRARLEEVLVGNGGRLRMKTMVAQLVRPEILALTRAPNPEALRDLCLTIQTTGPMTVRQLIVELGLSPVQLTVFLAAAARLLPAEVYRRLLGASADPLLVRRIIDSARAAGLDQGSPPAAYDQFVENLFKRFTLPPNT